MLSLWRHWLQSKTNRAARRSQRSSLKTIQIAESRQLLAATGIVVNNNGTIVSFAYSGGVFNQSGGGGLPAPVMPSPGMPPTAGPNGFWEYVTTGDVNGDGRVDIIAKTSGVPTASPAKPGQIWVGINTGSGSTDAFTYSVWDDAIPVSGTIGSTTNILTWGDMQVADFTGDGKADVLGRVRETGQWYLWTTNSAGTGFTTETTGLTTKSSAWGNWLNTVTTAGVNEHFQWRDALVGDFNGDGIQDLAGRQITNSTAPGSVDQWYVGLGTSTTTNRGTTGVPTNSFWNLTSWNHSTVWANAVVGDFNGDGKADIAGRSADARQTDGSRPGQWWVATTGATNVTVANTAWVTWQHANAGGAELHWRDIQTGDFNADGKADILGRTQGGDWYIAYGGQVAGTAPALVGSWGQSYPVVVAGDFTGDGKIDLAARKNGDNNWYLSTFATGMGSNTLPVPTLASPMWGGTALGTTLRKDFFVKGSPKGVLGSSLPLAMLDDLGRLNSLPYPQTGDGTYYHFILGRYNADGSLNWEDFGGGIPVGGNYASRYHLDFNGDNLPDVLTQDNNGQWWASENYGNSYVTTMSNFSFPLSEQRQILIGDFTGDGKDDLVSQKYTTSFGGMGTNYNVTWTLHVSNGNGTFNTIATPFLSRTYTNVMDANVRWLTGGFVADFDGDHKDDIVGRHKLTDNSNDPTWVDEVIFSNGAAAGSPVNQWILANTSNDPLPSLEGVGDFNNDGKADVWGLRNRSVIVGPPMLTEPRLEIWAGLSSGRGSSSQAATMVDKPFTSMYGFTTSQVDVRGSRAGRFDASLDALDDIVLEYAYDYNNVHYQELRTFKSTGGGSFVADIWSTSGRNGGEQYALVGDLDRDGSDDLIWIGTTPSHNINLFVRSTIKTIPWANSGVTISGNGVPSYIWTTSSRLRKRKP